jgi:hypothetical protein
MSKAIKTPFESADFERLVVKLKEIVRKETGADVDEERLGAVVYGAAMVYDATAFGSRFSKLNALKEPLSSVIKILKDAATRDAVLVILGARPLLAAGPYPEMPGSVVARYDHLLHELEHIAIRLPDKVKRRRGNPRGANAKDLRRMVSWLAERWTELTSKPFKNLWTDHGSEPVTNATQFVHQIVMFIDAVRLPELPTVTKNVRRSLSNNSAAS